MQGEKCSIAPNRPANLLPYSISTPNARSNERKLHPADLSVPGSRPGRQFPHPRSGQTQGSGSKSPSAQKQFRIGSGKAVACDSLVLSKGESRAGEPQFL